MTIRINGHEPKTFKFPGGECHVQLDVIRSNPLEVLHIHAELNSSDDIMTLLLAVDAIRRLRKRAKIILHIKYLPYARQDRVCNFGEPLSIKVMADLINSMKLNKVCILDPHSDVTPALINNCQVTTLAEGFCETKALSSIALTDDLVLVSPDAGAEKKVRELANAIRKPMICASKRRDVETGAITHTEVSGDILNLPMLIADDICDGGRTFIQLSKKLKEKGARCVFLYVSHGIFSNGLDCLRPHFEHIYCNHTMLREEEIDSKFLTVGE